MVFGLEWACTDNNARELD